jgi:hypothetical protein
MKDIKIFAGFRVCSGDSNDSACVVFFLPLLEFWGEYGHQDLVFTVKRKLFRPKNTLEIQKSRQLKPLKPVLARSSEIQAKTVNGNNIKAFIDWKQVLLKNYWLGT